MRSDGFAPLEGAEARVLVLGTLPGRRSLETQQYYAHPRNAFWPIALAATANIPLSRDHAFAMDYAQRVAHITSAGVGVWDVLAHCERPGSLDSAIVHATAVANDIAAFAQRHPELIRIVLNGKTAEQLFKRHVLTAANAERFADLQLLGVPSTSPAMASLSLEEKYLRWQPALQ